MAETLDAAIAQLAKRQHGYVTRSQLLTRGLSRQAIGRRLAASRLIPIYLGVYAVGHEPTHPLDRAHGALLACGPTAVLSHGSAAAVWGITKRWEMPFEVTVPTKRRRPAIRVHRAKLSRDDIRTNLGIRVTSPARTLLDMAPRLTDRQLTRAVDDLRRSYLRLDELRDALRRWPRHPGARRLRRLADAPRGPSRSDFEVAFQVFVEQYDLPEPWFNHRLAGVEVDAFFPVERVVVELDGWSFHSSRASFIGDRERDAKLLALGIPTLRVTWERLTGAAEREAARLHTILARRRQEQAA